MDLIYNELEKKLNKLTQSLHLLSLKLDQYIKESEKTEDYKMCEILLRYKESLQVKIVLDDLLSPFKDQGSVS